MQTSIVIDSPRARVPEANPERLSVTQQPIPIRIAGTGAYLPSQKICSTEFDQRWGKDDGWTSRQCGVHQRHIANPEETSSSMATLASKAALSAAGINADDLDCVVSACSVMEQVIPCLASQVQHKLGLGESGIPAFDINATCLSFLVALDQIACAMALGRYRHVLIVSSEKPSIGLNPSDHTTAPLFGDGAAAVVLEATNDTTGSALLSSLINTYGIGGEYCRFRAGGTGFWSSSSGITIAESAHFEMDGRSLYRLAARYFPSFLKKLLNRTNITLDELRLIIPHQASGRALDHLQKILRFGPDRLVRIIEKQGNQVAASLPSALHNAVSSGRLKRGDLFAMLGTGAGMSIGGAILRF